MKMSSQLLPLSAAAIVSLIVVGFAAHAGSDGTGPSFKGPIGLQLYSLRDQFPKDVTGTLDEVKGWGIRYAELAGTYGLTAEKFKQELKSRGIEAISAHFPYERY